MVRSSEAISDPVELPAPIQELATVRDWFRFAVSRFQRADLAYGHGTSNAVDEAAFLVLEALRLPIDGIGPWLDARLLPVERRRLAALIDARIETRKPAAYLVGAAYIQGRRFVVDERVIVPRSFIGELIIRDGLAAAVATPETVGRVLDVCTGCGCLAILAAEMFPAASVDAIDISEEALAVAKINIELHGVGERVRLLRGDLFQPLADQRYDLIVANPPYVAAAEMTAFPPEHRAEPRLAHAGGHDGLDLVRRILLDAGGALRPGGVLVMEVGTGQSLILDEFPDLDALWLDTEASEGEVMAVTAEALADFARTRVPKGKR